MTNLVPHAPSPFEIVLGTGVVAFRVVSFRGTEKVSSTYVFDVRVTTHDADDALDGTLLEQPACLALHTGGAPRLVHGIVGRITSEGVVAHGQRLYAVRIVPRVALMKRRRMSRIFQDRSVVDIVTALAAERGLLVRWRITGDYPRRTYCVQHQETDYAFMKRLLAEEGLFFYFDHPAEQGDDNRTGFGSTEVLTISDTAEYYPALDGGDDLAFRSALAGSGLTPHENHVWRFDFVRQGAPRAALLREYDYHRPTLALEDVAAAGKLEVGSTRGARGRAGGGDDRAQLATPAVLTQSVYEHHGDFGDTQVEPVTAARELEQHRARIARGRGESWCRRLMPGRTFRLADHDAEALNQRYVVTGVEHEGHSADTGGAQGQRYANRFECAPATVRVRPARPKHRLHQVLETAVVVGPEGQEIHTDELGRIKVQFHWDIAGKRNEHSSCWMRVAQTWAGAGWGAQFIPRVGMEVLVTFLGGDVDRPLVTGCVYNATHPLPFGLPAASTVSGIRTQSSPGGDGFNELSFDDAKGRELVFLHAQRDQHKLVRNDEREAVGHDQIIAVGNNRSATIGKVDSILVGEKHEVIVAEPSQTGMSMVDQNIGYTTGGASMGLAKGDVNMSAKGNISLDAAGNVGLKSGGNIDLDAAGDVAIKAGGAITLTAGGVITITGADVIVNGGTVKMN